jgi:TetR/AcrR family transcriptional regulator, transcriptional repressor for nem operon
MPRDGAATRDRILATAERLITDQGYAATSVDQVIADSSSSKGAFFHHFRSKAELATHVVERYVRGDLAHLEAGLAAVAEIDDPAQRVLAFVRHYEDGADELLSEQSGCLYATVLAEREFSGSEINRQVAEATLAWRRAIVALLEPALAGRDGADAVDPDALADHLYTTFEGGFILCRTMEDPSAMRAQLRVFRQLLEALLVSSR